MVAAVQLILGAGESVMSGIFYCHERGSPHPLPLWCAGWTCCQWFHSSTDHTDPSAPDAGLITWAAWKKKKNMLVTTAVMDFPNYWQQAHENFKRQARQSHKRLELLSFDLSTKPSAFWIFIQNCKCSVILSVSSMMCSQNEFIHLSLKQHRRCSRFTHGFNTDLAVSPLTQFLNSIWYRMSASVPCSTGQFVSLSKENATEPRWGKKRKKKCCLANVSRLFGRITSQQEL